MKHNEVDMLKIRKDFPILSRKVNGKVLTYLDSTATSLKPISVINAVSSYYSQYSANVFRGIYSISEEATAAYEDARAVISRFIGASSSEEVIFTRNASEAINVVAYSIAMRKFKENDEVVSTILEHHSNFVPWQQLSIEKRFTLRVIDSTADGQIDMTHLDRIISKKTKLCAITAASNVTGSITPVKQLVSDIKRINPNCLVLVDAAQAVPHMPVNVVDWGADFVAFSGHKMLGPTGIGVLWGKREILESMSPFMYGGDMIREVTLEKTVFAPLPHKFEAGTPHIAGAIGLGEAVRYLETIGMDNVRNHEITLTDYAMKSLADIKGLTYLGPTSAIQRGGIFSCSLKGAHPHDVAQILDTDNICVRSGTHCAMPLHKKFGLSSTFRASFYIYTTTDDIDCFVQGVRKVKVVLKIN